MDPYKQAPVMKTMELARIYESQGHIREALDIYTYLDGQSSTPETAAGLSRMKSRLDRMKNRTGVTYPDLVVDSDLIEDSLSDSSPVPESEAVGDCSAPAEAPSPVQRLLEQWLDLVILEDRLEALQQL